MAIKQIFPRIVLVFGLASVLVASMPSPGQCVTCQQLYEKYQQVYNPAQGWDSKFSWDTATGKCTLTGTRTDPNTGKIFRVANKANDSTGSQSRCRGFTNPNGYSEERCEKFQDNEWLLTSWKYWDATGWEVTWTFDPDGGPKSREERNPDDGSVETITYDPSSCHIKDGYIYCNETSRTETYKNGSSSYFVYDPSSCREVAPRQGELYGQVSCNVTSDTERSKDGSSSTTIYSSNGSETWAFDADGNVTYTKYGPDGKAIAKQRFDRKTGETIVYNCHLKNVFGNEECVDMSRRGPEGLGQYGSRPQDTPRGQSHERAGGGFESATKAPQILPGLKPVDSIGAKPNLKDEVLGQIEGKPRGDLGARERVNTEVSDQSKVGALQVTPKGKVKPKGPLPVRPKGEDLAGPKAGVPTGLGDRFETKPGEAVGLNSQPLPLGPAPDKSVQLNDTTKLESGSAGHKEKLRVPRGQSTGQTQLQGAGAAKQKVQPQAVQPFRDKKQLQDFRSPAGASGAYPGLR